MIAAGAAPDDARDRHGLTPDGTAATPPPTAAVVEVGAAAGAAVAGLPPGPPGVGQQPPTTTTAVAVTAVVPAVAEEPAGAYERRVRAAYAASFAVFGVGAARLTITEPSQYLALALAAGAAGEAVSWSLCPVPAGPGGRTFTGAVKLPFPWAVMAIVRVWLVMARLVASAAALLPMHRRQTRHSSNVRHHRHRRTRDGGRRRRITIVPPVAADAAGSAVRIDAEDARTGPAAEP